VPNEYPRDGYQDSYRGTRPDGRMDGRMDGRAPAGGGRGPYRGGRDGRDGRDGGMGGGERRGIPLSELDPTTTEASRKVIGASIDVHKALGPGFEKSVYVAALLIELDAAGVKYEVDRRSAVIYKDKRIGEACADLFVEGRFFVDVFARPGPVGTYERLEHRAKLKVADLELGLIINFAEKRLKDGLVRVVNIEKISRERGLGMDEEGDEPEGEGQVHDFER